MHSQKTQSRCLRQGRRTQRTRCPVFSGSRHRRVWPCTRPCWRICNHLLGSRWSWRDGSKNRYYSHARGSDQAPKLQPTWSSLWRCPRRLGSPPGWRTLTEGCPTRQRRCRCPESRCPPRTSCSAATACPGTPPHYRRMLGKEGECVKDTARGHFIWRIKVTIHNVGVDLPHWVPCTGSGRPVHMSALLGTATRHREPNTSHSVYS